MKKIEVILCGIPDIIFEARYEYFPANPEQRRIVEGDILINALIYIDARGYEHDVSNLLTISPSVYGEIKEQIINNNE